MLSSRFLTALGCFRRGVGSEGELGDDRDSLGVDDIGQLFVLRNEGVVRKAHHAAEVIVVGRHAGKSGDDSADAAFGNFSVMCRLFR